MDNVNHLQCAIDRLDGWITELELDRDKNKDKLDLEYTLRGVMMGYMQKMKRRG